MTTGVDRQTSMTEIQSRIANGILIAFAIFAIPGLAASLWRIQAIGWQPVMVLHAAIAGFIWFITIFRSRILFRMRGIVILGAIYLLALGGFINFGLIGAGYPALLAAAVLASVLFGARGGLIAIFLGVLFIAAMGFAFSANLLRLPLDLNLASTQIQTWALILAGFILLGSGVVAATVGLNRALIRSVTDLENHKLNLENQVAERTRDLTKEIKDHEATVAALRIAIAEADKANQAKSQFLSSMSHELRTPLNTILGFGQLLGIIADGPKAEKQKGYVEQILNGGKHLLDLVGQVLDLSAIEAGQLPSALEKISVKEACQDCLTLIDTEAAGRGLNIESNLESDSTIEADYVRFKQILLNLLSNAIKYNREAGNIRFACTNLPNNLVRVSVTDSGDGIAPDRQGDLFSPFKRLGKESGEIKGTGIGLTITKQLAEAMGGKVGFESELGVGSTFWVEFPIYDGIANETKSSANDQAAGGQHQRLPNEAKILYIEDNLANLELMENIIDELDGMTLFSARTAEVGVTMAMELLPDLILMDVNLPSMDGIEAMNALGAIGNTKDIPVIAVSAAVMKDDYERGMAAGFKAYLTKPFEVAKLVEAINNELQE